MERIKKRGSAGDLKIGFLPVTSAACILGFIVKKC
jgi:hypothetical protein